MQKDSFWLDFGANLRKIRTECDAPICEVMVNIGMDSLRAYRALEVGLWPISVVQVCVLADLFDVALQAFATRHILDLGPWLKKVREELESEPLYEDARDMLALSRSTWREQEMDLVLCENLVALMKAQGMGWRELAQRAELTKADLLDLQGEDVPSFFTLVKVAEALGVWVDYLLAGEEELPQGQEERSAPLACLLA